METINGVEHYGGQLVGWTLNNPETMFWVAVGALVAAIGMGSLVLFMLLRNEPQLGEREVRIKRMMKLMGDRQRKLDVMYADMIGDLLFELWFRGAISRQEYRRDSRRFGVKYKLLDLLPRRNKPEAIKARIRKNVEALRNDHKAMREALEKIRSGGYAVLDAKAQAMPNPDPLRRQVKVYLVRGKRLGMKSQ